MTHVKSKKTHLTPFLVAAIVVNKKLANNKKKRMLAEWFGTNFFFILAAISGHVIDRLPSEIFFLIFINILLTLILL